MSELPDEFDSKRELDGWLEENIMGNDVCYKPPSKCHIRCSKYILKTPGPNSDSKAHEPARFKVDMVYFYTKMRRDALDLLECFMSKSLVLDWSMSGSGIEIEKGIHINSSRTIAKEGFEELNKVDPLAISVAIYRAYHEVLDE